MLSLFHLLSYAIKSAVPMPPGLLFHHPMPISQSLLAQHYSPNTFFCIPAYIRIVHFFQEYLYHIVLLERACAGIHINQAEKADFIVCKLNENIAAPKSALSFSYEVLPVTP